MKWLFVCIWIAVAPMLLALDARVRTSSGDTFEGEITIDSKLGLVITNAEIGLTNVPLSMVASALFNLSTQTPSNEAVSLATLPAGWTNQDIGYARVPGKVRYENGNFTLSSSGSRIWTPEPDQFGFAYRRFRGDGQIMARVAKTEAAMAGIMFRRTLDPISEFVVEAITPGPEGLVFRSRRDQAHRDLTHSQGDWLNQEEIKPPCWLKLIRKDKRFVGFKSEDDGITWQRIYDAPVEWERAIYAGLFVMGETNALKSATFTDVLTEDEEDDKAKLRNTPSKIQVFLNDGSVLAADSISADQTKMKIGFANVTNAVSLFAIARLVVRPIPDRLKRELPAGRKGVLLNSGDFFEGDLRLIDKEHVQVASILFGSRNFPAEKVLAVMLSDSIELAAKYVIRMQAGSVIRARSITAGRDAIIAEELKLGPLELPLGQLSSIEQGGR